MPWSKPNRLTDLFQSGRGKTPTQPGEEVLCHQRPEMPATVGVLPGMATGLSPLLL